MSKAIKTIIVSFVMVLLFGSTVFAESKTLSFDVAYEDGIVKVSFEEKAESCYLIFDTDPGEYKINGKAAIHPYFIHQYLEFEPAEEIIIEGAKPKEMYFFDGTDTPDFVQKWQEPNEKADMLLISSHADDEQLFFAGLLPYYSKVRGLKVQVAYATDHKAELLRHHERLNGLWEVGIKVYPVSSGYGDYYSESAEGALANLAPYGISEESVIEWEKSLIEKFAPKVIVSHDLNGEYGHGMHKLISGTIVKAIQNAETDYPFLNLVYLHLYDQRKLSLNVIDQPSDILDGKTPFQITQEKGFACHKSQHWTWFKPWLFGSSGQITEAKQIKNYSPLQYGCIYASYEKLAQKASDAGDFFAGLNSYEEERIIAETQAALKAQLEEDARKEAEAQETAKKAETQKLIVIISAAVLLVIIIAICIAISKKNKSTYKAKH